MPSFVTSSAIGNMLKSLTAISGRWEPMGVSTLRSLFIHPRGARVVVTPTCRLFRSATTLLPTFADVWWHQPGMYLWSVTLLPSKRFLLDFLPEANDISTLPSGESINGLLPSTRDDQ